MKSLIGKILHFALLCSFLSSNSFAQTPVISAHIGYPVGRPAAQIAYGNNKYVLLTTYLFNQVYQSSTGTSWNAVTASGLTANQLNFIAYGAGVFVVVGNGGIIQTSTDGIAWTTVASGTTSDLSRIYFINNSFFAIGNSRTLLTSSDGISWTPITFNVGASSDFFMSLTYGNGYYVLGARNNSGSWGIVYRSATAGNNSWSVATNTPSNNGINRIQFLNNKFWAFMIGNRMFTSADGSAWTEVTNSIALTQPDNSTIAWTNQHQIFNAVWDGTRYSFYGSSQYYSGYGSTFTSTDGINFTLLTKTAYIVPQESSIINGRYFVCGNEGIVSSGDGMTYNHSGSSFREMVKTANKYVAVGMTSSEGQMYNSTDFTAWTNRSLTNIRELYTVAYDGAGTLLAGGYTGVYSSVNDGDSWTKIYNNLDETFSSMAYGNGRFVAAVSDGTGYYLKYSEDGGATWTIANTLNNWYNRIRYINGRFFAFGSNNDDWTGRIVYSADGIEWTDVTPALGFNTYYYKDVAFDGTKYHFLGVDESQSFFTVSTASPDIPSSYGNLAVADNTPPGVTLGGGWDEGLLTYSAGRFTGAVIDIATGQDYIITSGNGNSWTALPQNSYSTITDAYANGQTVQLLGRSNAFFTVNYGGTLPLSLLKFNGSPLASSVLLDWRTGSEKNTKQFVVEHSTDGRSWNAVGKVSAAGNRSANSSYNFTHFNPAKGVNYYRLLQQDIDETGTYTRIITVYFGQGSKTRLYPNPVSDHLIIHTPDAQPGFILIFNSTGQPVKRTAITGYQTKLNMSGLPAGTYIAEIKQGSQLLKLPFIKN